MKIRKHKANIMFRFNTLRIDFKPMKGVVIRGKTPTEQVVTDLGVRIAIGSCWPSIRNGLLFGTDRQYEFRNVRAIATQV